jgi:amino acid transporter
MPRTGGIYEYLRRAWGPTAAFVYGWARLFLLGPSAAGSFARLAAVAAIEAFGLAADPALETALAIGVLVACIASNLAGVRASSRKQAAITALKYLGTVGLAVTCLALPILPDAALPSGAPPSAAPASPLLGLFAALVSVMWAYDGWADLSSLGGEVRAPERTLPRALVLGVSAVTVVYVLVNLAYERTLGADGILASAGTGQMVATNAIAMTLGSIGRRALAALVFASCVGACMVGVLTGSRVFVAMASDGLFIRFLGHVDARGVPTRAVWLTGLVGAIYVSIRSFEQLADSFVVGAFPFYLLAVAGIFVLRRRPELAARLRVPLHPLSTLVFLAGAVLLLVGALSDVEGMAAWAFGVVLLGVPVGWAWQRAGGR